MKATAVKNKKNKNLGFDRNPIEAFKGIGDAVVDSVINDLGRDTVSDLWGQLLGGEKKSGTPQSGELREGEEINFKTEKRTPSESEPNIDYRREVLQPEVADRENTQIIKSKIQEILIELKKIAATSKEIAVEFKEVTVEQRIEKPGDYHLNFFEWMLSLVRSAREKIEDSGAWLNAMKSKKAKRGYWAMFQKHGTTFGLSNERIVATQTG